MVLRVSFLETKRLPFPRLTMPSSWWGDNPDATPVDKWIPCTTENNGQNYSDTSFKLTQKLQIGDFYFALKQNFTETMFVLPQSIPIRV